MNRKPSPIPWGAMVILFTLPVLAYLAFAAGKKGLEAYTLWQQAEGLRAEITVLKERNRDLREQIEYLRSDAYLERIAREELDLMKPGDVPVIVIYPTVTPTPAPSPSPTPRPSSLPQQLWQEVTSRLGGEP